MKTPILDELEKHATHSYLRRWIIRELGDEPVEFSSLTPGQQGMVDTIHKISKYPIDHSREAGRSYYVLRGEDGQPDIRVVAHYYYNEQSEVSGVVFWIRPNDMIKIFDTDTLLDLLLKEF